jgi:hypothetical protein
MRLLPLLIASAAAAADLPVDSSFAEVYTFGACYHVVRGEPWNEFNPGLGIGLGTIVGEHVDLRISAGAYQDSFGEMARFLMPGGAYVIGSRTDWHGTIGLNIGYMVGSGFTGIGILPVASFGFDRVELCLTGIPTAWSREDDHNGRVYPATGLVAAFLRVRVASW